MGNSTNLIPSGNEDFFRGTIDDNLSNGVNDVNEGIYHNGVVHIGNANITDNTRFEHLGIASYTGNGTFRHQSIQTQIPWDSSIMPTLNIKGYGYGTSDTIDIQLVNTTGTNQWIKVAQGTSIGNKKIDIWPLEPQLINAVRLTITKTVDTPVIKSFTVHLCN